MKRKNKIIIGIVTIIFAMISACIGFWLLGGKREAYSFTVRFVLRFFLMVTPVFTILAVINLLKRDA